MKRRTYRALDGLQECFNDKKNAIHSRLAEFGAIRPERYFYELAYCLLTPQSSAVHAAAAVETLEKADFLHGQAEAAGVLRRKSSYIRFHNTKARRLAEARTRHDEIVAALSNGASGEELRIWLIRNVKGLGWKEASHFLRNIGYRNLAILDRHILKNLRKHGVIRTIPASLTPRKYLTIERRFRKFATAIGITIDELDLLFWSMETGEILK